MFKGWARVRVPSSSITTICLSIKNFRCLTVQEGECVGHLVPHVWYAQIKIVIEPLMVLYMVAIAKLEAFKTWHCKNPRSYLVHQDMHFVLHHPFPL